LNCQTGVFIFIYLFNIFKALYGMTLELGAVTGGGCRCMCRIKWHHCCNFTN